MTRRIVIAGFIGLLLLAAAPASAQPSACTPSAIARAGGSAVSPLLDDALVLNPAALTGVLGSAATNQGLTPLPAPRQGAALASSPATRGVTVLLAQTCVAAGGDLLQFDTYNKQFTGGREHTPESIDQVLDDWFGPDPAASRAMRLRTRVQPVAVALRRADWAAAFALRGRTLADVTVSRGWLDLFGQGLPESGEVPMNADMRLASFIEIAASYARRFDRLSVGITPKFLLGLAFADGRIAAEARSTPDHVGLAYRLDAFASGGLGDFVSLSSGDDAPSLAAGDLAGAEGSGFAVDLGATWQLDESWLIGGSVTDLGSLRWTGTTRFSDRLQDPVFVDSLDFSTGSNTGGGSGGMDSGAGSGTTGGILGDRGTIPVDSLLTSTYLGTPFGSQRTSSLPAVFRFGVAHISARRLLTVDVAMPLNRAIGNIAWGPVLALGAAQRIGSLWFHGGLRSGVGTALQTSLGLEVRVLGFGVAVGGSMTPRSVLAGTGGRYAVGAGIRLR